MIHSDPTMTNMTMRTPNANAKTLLTLSGTGGDVQEEDQVHADLSDRQHHQRNRDAGAPNQERPGNEKRHHR